MFFNLLIFLHPAATLDDRLLQAGGVAVFPLIVIMIMILSWNIILGKRVVRRRAEYIERREQYRATLNQLKEGVIKTDAEGFIQWLNSTAIELTGADREDYTGWKIDDVINLTAFGPDESVEFDLKKIFGNTEGREVPDGTILRVSEYIEYMVSGSITPIFDEQSSVAGWIFVFRDISGKYRSDQAVRAQLEALTHPIEDIDSINFEALFDAYDIQQLQDVITKMTGLASSIFSPESNILTKRTYRSPFCFNIVRKTPKGLAACIKSDQDVADEIKNGIGIKRCGCAGLWEAALEIRVVGKLIATWYIGGARDPSQNIEEMKDIASNLSCNEDLFVAEFLKLPVMNAEVFGNIVNALRIVIRQLTETAYQNIRLARLINEKKESERKITNLRNYLSNTMDSMPSIILGLDSELRIVFGNKTAADDPRFEDIVGGGEPLSEVFELAESEDATIHEAISRSVSTQFSKQWEQARGTIVYETWTVYPLTGGDKGGAVIRIDDITESVRMKNLLVQGEKMYSIGGLAAGMAHEINNPLAGMIQTVSVLSNRLLSGIDISANREAAEKAGIDLEALNKYYELRGIPRMLASIHEAGDRVTGIVGNMLSFSRKGDAGKGEHSAEQIMERAIEIACTDWDLSRHWDFRAISIIRDYEPDLPDIICEDRQIQQVLLNILRNGAQAMQSAELENPEFRIRIFQTDDAMLCFEIADNGTGMDEQTQRKIFDPFYTTRAVGEGTGLGLSVAYFIISENHSGEIFVDSIKGQGTKVIIRLPEVKGREV